MVTLALLQQCTKDDRKAHYELYKASFACMFNACKRYCFNDDDVKSMVNMVFLKVVTNLNSFLEKERTIEAYELWVRRIAVNYMIDEFRKSKKYRQAMMLTSDFSLINLPENTVFDFKEDMQEIMNAIAKLPVIARTIFTLYTIDGYKHKEIAAMMKITESTSKVHFHNAKIKLKAILMNKTITNFR